MFTCVHVQFAEVAIKNGAIKNLLAEHLWTNTEIILHTKATNGVQWNQEVYLYTNKASLDLNETGPTLSE